MSQYLWVPRPLFLPEQNWTGYTGQARVRLCVQVPGGAVGGHRPLWDPQLLLETSGPFSMYWVPVYPFFIWELTVC